jgi:hypothetical protein
MEINHKNNVVLIYIIDLFVANTKPLNFFFKKIYGLKTNNIEVLKLIWHQIMSITPFISLCDQIFPILSSSWFENILEYKKPLLIYNGN